MLRASVVFKEAGVAILDLHCAAMSNPAPQPKSSLVRLPIDPLLLIMILVACIGVVYGFREHLGVPSLGELSQDRSPCLVLRPLYDACFLGYQTSLEPTFIISEIQQNPLFWLWEVDATGRAVPWGLGDGWGNLAPLSELKSLTKENPHPHDSIWQERLYSDKPHELVPQDVATALLAPYIPEFGRSKLQVSAQCDRFHVAPVRDKLHTLLRTFGPVYYYRQSEGDPNGGWQTVEFSMNGKRQRYGVGWISDAAAADPELDRGVVTGASRLADSTVHGSGPGSPDFWFELKEDSFTHFVEPDISIWPPGSHPRPGGTPLPHHPPS